MPSRHPGESRTPDPGGWHLLSNSPLLYDTAEINDENWGELTLRLAGGKVRYSVKNDGASFEAAGTYTTDGDVLKFQFDELGETWGFRWSL